MNIINTVQFFFMTFNVALTRAVSTSLVPRFSVTAWVNKGRGGEGLVPTDFFLRSCVNLIHYGYDDNLRVCYN